MAEERGSMTVREAGIKGGMARKAQAEAQPGTYEAMGKAGGAATWQKHGRKHYARIGRQGGKVSTAKPEES